MLTTPPTNVQQVVRLPPQVYPPDQRTAVEWRVPIINTTGIPVAFADPKASCGCSGASLESTSLPPAGQTLFTLNVKPDGSARVRSVNLNVKPDSAADDVWWRYWLEAPLYPEAAFEPRQTLVGPVRVDDQPTRQVVLTTYAAAQEALPKLIAIESDNELLTATVNHIEVSRNEDKLYQRDFTVVLRISPSHSERGAFRAQVTARLEEPLAHTQVDLSSLVTWSVPSLFNVSPTRVFIGNLAERLGPISVTVALQSAEVDDLEVLSIHSSHPGVSGSIQEASGGPLRHLLVRVDPGKVSGPLWTELVVETNNRLEPTLKIAVAALP